MFKDLKQQIIRTVNLDLFETRFRERILEAVGYHQSLEVTFDLDHSGNEPYYEVGINMPYYHDANTTDPVLEELFGGQGYYVNPCLYYCSLHEGRSRIPLVKELLGDFDAVTIDTDAKSFAIVINLPSMGASSPVESLA